MTALPLRQEHLAGAHLHADREHMIESLAPAIRGGKVAEVGVALGDFSARMIALLEPSEFHAFDIFGIHEWPMLWGKPTAEILDHRTHRGFYESRFAREIEAGRMRLFEGDSSLCLSKQPDAFYDLIYIDGAHDLEGVRRDAEAAVRKIKLDGVMVFNDYIAFDHVSGTEYGVVNVVNELCVNAGWRIIGFALQPQMFCDVALTRLSR
jgi:hypothetical protein